MILKVARKLKSCHASVEAWLAEFIQEIPEFLNSFAEGYQKFDHLDPVSRHEYFLRKNAQKDKYVFGKRCVFRVHSLWSLAEFYRSHYRYTEAERHYLHCTELLFSEAAAMANIQKQKVAVATGELNTEKHLPFEFRKKIICVVNFLALYYKHKDAEAMLRRFMPHVEAISSAEEKASDLELLAMICSKVGKDKEATKCLLAAQELLKPLYGPLSAKTVDLLERHRRVLIELHSEEVLKKCNRNLDLLTIVLINEKALGQDNAYNVRALRDLASFYRSEGMHDFAENVLIRAEIAYLANTVKGAPYPALPYDLRKLASLYRKRGDMADETMAFRAERRADQLQATKPRK